MGTRRPFTALDQDARVARAFLEAGDYTFAPHDAGTWRCDGPRGSFLVSEQGDCSCEDATYTTGPVGGRCKHAILLGRWLIATGFGLLAREEGHCRNCGVVEPAEVLVALDDLGAYVCRDCYEGQAEPAPCPKASERTHLGWYCPACLRDQPPVSVDDAPGPLSPADLAHPLRLTMAEEAHLAAMDAMFDKVFG